MAQLTMERGHLFQLLLFLALVFSASGALAAVNIDYNQLALSEIKREELPPPAGLHPPERGARLLPPR